MSYWFQERLKYRNCFLKIEFFEQVIMKHESKKAHQSTKSCICNPFKNFVSEEKGNQTKKLLLFLLIQPYNNYPTKDITQMIAVTPICCTRPRYVAGI